MLDVPLDTYASSLEQTSSAPLEFFSTSRTLRARLSLGWPRLERIQDKLVYKGPLPKNCACNHVHTPMIGTSSDDVFCSSSSHTFGSDFWKHIIVDHPLDSELSSLRDEGLQTDFAPLRSVGLSPLLSPSLASGIGSLRYVYEAWKAGNLTRATLRDIVSTESYNTFFSTPPSYSLVTSPRSRLASLWKVSLVSPSAPVSDVSTGLSAPPSSSTSSFRLRHARSRSPTSLNAPLVRLRPRGDVSSVVTGALPGPLSARCVSCQFPFCLMINFPCPLIIHLDRSSGS